MTLPLAPSIRIVAGFLDVVPEVLLPWVGTRSISIHCRIDCAPLAEVMICASPCGLNWITEPELLPKEYCVPESGQLKVVAEDVLSRLYVALFAALGKVTLVTPELVVRCRLSK